MRWKIEIEISPFFFIFQRMKCQKKEPCRLFTVRKDVSRPEAESANLSSLCACPKHKRCPKHHLDAGVIPSVMYSDSEFRTYAGYCR